MVKGSHKEIVKSCIVPEGSGSYNFKRYDPLEMLHYVTFQLGLVFTKVYRILRVK